MPTDLFNFIGFFVFYLIFCIVIGIIYIIFKRFFSVYKFLYVPLAIACIVGFPSGIFILGIIYGKYLQRKEQKVQNQDAFEDIYDFEDDEAIEFETNRGW